MDEIEEGVVGMDVNGRRGVTRRGSVFTAWHQIVMHEWLKRPQPTLRSSVHRGNLDIRQLPTAGARFAPVR